MKLKIFFPIQLNFSFHFLFLIQSLGNPKLNSHSQTCWKVLPYEKEISLPQKLFKTIWWHSKGFFKVSRQYNVVSKSTRFVFSYIWRFKCTRQLSNFIPLQSKVFWYLLWKHSLKILAANIKYFHCNPLRSLST